MRTVLSALLLVSAATTAVAADDPDRREVAAPDDVGREARAEPPQQVERAARVERIAPVERTERRERHRSGDERMERPEVVERPQSIGRAEQILGSSPDVRQVDGSNVGRAEAPSARSGDAPDSVANWRSGERRRDGGRPLAADDVGRTVDALPPGTRLDGRRDRERWNGRDGERFRDRLSDRRSAEHWRRDWRRDHRYDWRRHRDRHRERFSIGIYVDPFGWRYRPMTVGWSLPPQYRAGRYWIADPWDYRLPEVPWPYRWIRYWDDALLIDVRTGRVVDVVPQFFW